MEAFCTLVATRDCDAEVRSELEQSSYEVWDIANETFISKTIMYCKEDDSVDTMNYDVLQKEICSMAEDLDVSLSNIVISINIEKGE